MTKFFEFLDRFLAHLLRCFLFVSCKLQPALTLKGTTAYYDHIQSICSTGCIDRETISLGPLFQKQHPAQRSSDGFGFSVPVDFGLSDVYADPDGFDIIDDF
jgi:hypothetical protein